MKSLLIIIQILKCISIIGVCLFFLFSYCILLVLGFFIPKEEIKKIIDDLEERVKKLSEL